MNNEEQHPLADEDHSHTNEAEPPAGFAAWLRPPFRQQGGISELQFLPIYLAAGMVCFLLLWTVARYLLPPGASRLWGQLLGEVVFAAAAIAPAVGIARIEGRGLGDYGLPVRQTFGKQFWSGAAWGIVSLSVLLFILDCFGDFSYGGVVLHGARVWKFAVFWAAFFLFVALFEEFLFRGYTLFAIKQLTGFWPSALFLSAIFAYTHHANQGETWTGALGAGAIGLFFCLTLQRTGNLWFAVGLHASWDWTQTFLYGVPDSGVVEPGHLLQASLHGSRWITGGSVGPEGSILVFVIIALMWFVFDRVYPKKGTAT